MFSQMAEQKSKTESGRSLYALVNEEGGGLTLPEYAYRWCIPVENTLPQRVWEFWGEIDKRGQECYALEKVRVWGNVFLI